MHLPPGSCWKTGSRLGGALTTGHSFRHVALASGVGLVGPRTWAAGKAFLTFGSVTPPATSWLWF